jgi:PKD repeat protein
MTEVQRVVLFVAVLGVLFLTAGVGTVAGQSSVTEEFNETYGGPDNDTAYSVVQTDDGGFAIAGQTESFGSGGSDAWLIKTDPDGNEEFNRTYGGVDNDTAYSVVQTDDGGFAITGLTGKTGTFTGDAWLIKTDANGNVEFKETFGGSDRDSASSVVQTNDGGYALAGSTQSFVPGYEFQNGWLIKTDPNGNVETNETLGDTYRAGSILQTDDGGFAIAGQTDDSPDWPPFVGWFAKTDVNGNDEFSETFAFGGPRFATDLASSIVQTDDGGFVLSGWFNSERSAWLVKTDSSGSEQVNETFGGSDDDIDSAHSVVQTDDGGFAIAGKTESFGPRGDMWFIKTDSSGNEEFNETYGGPDNDRAFSVVQTDDGGFAIAGQTESFGSGGEDAWLVGVSEGGSSIDDSSFRIYPYPVEKGETPTVFVNVTNADNVQIKVDGEAKDMQNTSGNMWTREISSSVNDERGKRVNLEITAGSDRLSKIENAYPRTQLPRDTDTEPGTKQLHYYIFKNVQEVPVAMAKFQNQNLSRFNLDSRESVLRWERAREYDINTYMGSGRGSSGSIGFDLIYYDNNKQFYTVKEKSKYIGVIPAWGGVCKLAIEAKNEVGGFGGDRWVTTHPGPLDIGAKVSPSANQCAFSSNVARAYMNMGYVNGTDVDSNSHHYGIWLEELSHLYLGMGDLYSSSIGGNVHGGLPTEKTSSGVFPYTGLMASSSNNLKRTKTEQRRLQPILPQPYSVLSRTELNNDGKLGDTQSDPDWPWVDDNIVDISESGEPIDVLRVNEYGITNDEKVPILDTQTTGLLFDGDVKYLFEGHIEENKVRGYKITGGRHTRMDSAVLVDESMDGERSKVTGGKDIKFDVEHTGEKFNIEQSYDADEDSIIASIETSIYIRKETLSTGISRIFEEAPNVTTPDIDLRAVDSQGRVTGVTEGGEFVNQIPGANASGDTSGIEWISVPNDADVEFEVSSADVQQFINETNVSEENVTANYTTTVSTTGEDAEVVTEDGNVTVTNSTTKVVTENKSIEPGQTENAVNEKAIAGFSRSPRVASPGEEVRFNASISTNLDGTIQTYEWDLDNDGQTEATGLTANRSYSTTGNYTVSLTVTGDNGETDTETKTVTVEGAGLFTEALPGFSSPPTNTQELDDTLYEDVDGDGDGTDASGAVLLWSELVQNPQAFDDLTQEQIDALDWNGDGNLSPADAVILWSEKVQA